jgi:hypothetical protein
VPSGTSIQANVTAMVGIIVAAIVIATLLIALRRLHDERQARPLLPIDDRPPAGLGRLVPVGAQVEDECRRGLAALESWLLSRRHAGPGGA